MKEIAVGALVGAIIIGGLFGSLRFSSHLEEQRKHRAFERCIEVVPEKKECAWVLK